MVMDFFPDGIETRIAFNLFSVQCDQPIPDLQVVGRGRMFHLGQIDPILTMVLLVVYVKS